MKNLLMVTILLAAALTAAVAGGEGDPRRPPGVAPGDWIAISDSLGVVLVTEEHGRLPVQANRHDLLPAPPPTVGYFMVRQGRAWRRLIVVEPVKGPGAAG